MMSKAVESDKWEDRSQREGGMQHRVTPDEPREVLPCAVQPDGVDDVDSQRELSWPNVGREVNHRRRKYRLEQEVSREVAMNELCRRVTRG